MFQVKALVLCAILLVFIRQTIEAGKLTNAKINQRHDKELQTFIYESNGDDDVQADATTIYPPLIEEPSNPVSIEAISSTKKAN